MSGRSKALALMFLLTLVTYLDRVAISATAGEMSAELGLSKTEMGKIFSAFVIGYVLFEIPGGWLADRFGARSLLTRIVLWWSAFTALTGAAWSYWSLWWIRLLFGCGEAGAFPGCAAAIGRWFPSEERGRAQATIMVGSRLGAACAPPLVIAMASALGWRKIYGLLAVLGVAWAALWQRWYKDRPEDHPAVDAAELQLIQAGRGEPAAKAEPISWRTLARSRNVWALCIMYSGYTWGLYFYLTWLPTYLAEGRGVSWDRVGTAAMAPFLVAACANALGGWSSDRLAKRIPLRWARRGPAVFGLLLAAVCLATAALAEDNRLALPALALSFGFSDLILPICWATCLDVGQDRAGVLSGTMNSFGQVGAVLAPTVIGWIVESTGSWERPLLISAGYYVVSAVAWFAINAEQRLES